MRLILLRHAKSAWDDPWLSDHDRPLAPRGRRAAGAMRDYLEREGVAPQIVLTSTAARARETAERVFGESGAEIVRVPDLYMASAHELLEVAEAHGSGASCVALVAHDPGMHTLASRLVRGETFEAAEEIRAKYPTCAVAEFEVARGEDGSLDPDEAHLIRFVRPKDLPDAGDRRL